ncbi:hypothetical protein RFI_06310 [Reticulomyxa filosa]|uniref:alpha-1,3-mannosyl-glycoprotein 2-beta-N-acetylglucosaminyltransferase n=1 Tax=Reticulomyxa filosa TaxID=46433 RepID=X6NXV5_RETFI|nr:hypothetical protein RFI_06310 [Reticulomyxa filosa]|eukprot:ETO30811.1 hypothetical protein RFI_06310 [Reticulomyxa filosa]
MILLHKRVFFIWALITAKEQLRGKKKKGSNIQTDKRRHKGFEEQRWLAYHKISAHYKWLFTKMFDELQYKQLIILEDDMQISPDFFRYFEQLTPLLVNDPTVLCISAWNDNGQASFVQSPTALYRTDVFPGLGWMFTNKLWQEFKSNWPLAFWDDWLREEKQRKNRSCIRPEINRVYTFGEHGSSEGLFFQKYLKSIHLNKEDINWSAQNIDYLYHNNYDNWLKSILTSANVIDMKQLRQLKTFSFSSTEYLIWYEHIQQFATFAQEIGLMSDEKSGKARTSYNGIVTVRYHGHRVHFAHKKLSAFFFPS